MNERHRLANYQTQMLEILASAASPREALVSLKKLAKQADCPDEFDEADPAMVEVAMHLTRKWGVRQNSDG